MYGDKKSVESIRVFEFDLGHKKATINFGKETRILTPYKGEKTNHFYIMGQVIIFFLDNEEFYIHLGRDEMLDKGLSNFYPILSENVTKNDGSYCISPYYECDFLELNQIEEE